MEYSLNDIRNIAFEKINDRFSKGKYLGIEVTIDMTNAYINGPHLVGQVLTSGGQPKEFKSWKRSKEANEIIKYLTVQICTIEIIKDISDAPNGLRGAYIHPRLVPHVAQWASPIFADKVAIILNNKAIDEAIAEKNRIISEKEDSITRLERKIDDQSKQINELLGYAKKTEIDLENTQIELETVSVDMENMSQKIEKTSEQLSTVQAKLGIAVQTRVILDHIDYLNEVFAIYKNDKGVYCVIRCQIKDWYAAESRCKDAGFDKQIYYYMDPNAVNVWNRIKQTFPSNIGFIIGGFYIHIIVSEEELINHVNKIKDQKLVV